MAIPLVVGLGLAAVGAYKGAKAISDNNEASSINDDAKSIVSNAERRLNYARHECQEALENLGEIKVKILENNVKNFLTVFNQIRNIDFEHEGDLGDLHLKDFSELVVEEMSERVSLIAESGLGAAGGAASGALAAFGAYSGTMALATASTGTAISTLSGAAATNATLAWLGGGTLASGGMGVAGGTLALGALAAGPALLVAGWYMGAKAEKNLNDAYSNMAQAERFKADVDAAIALTNGIRDAANMAREILSQLRKYARRNLNDLRLVIDMLGVDYSKYHDKGKTVVLKNVKILQVIKVAIDTPILDKEGNLLGDVNSNLQRLNDCIQDDFRPALEN